MYYYNNELPLQQGWICPKCGRVNAPWLPTCGCVSSQTSGNSYLLKINSISQDSHEIAKDELQNDCSGCRHYTDGMISETVCNDCKRSYTDNYEPQTIYYPQVDGITPSVIVKDEPQTCSVSGRPYTDCCNCEYFKCTADEPQTYGYMTTEQTADYRKMLNNVKHEVYENIFTVESQTEYEKASEQREHDILYEPTYNENDGSM